MSPQRRSLLLILFAILLVISFGNTIHASAVNSSICGQFIRADTPDQWPLFLPQGSNEPWFVDPFIFDIFQEGKLARISDSRFGADMGPIGSYPNVKYLMSVGSVDIVSYCPNAFAPRADFTAQPISGDMPLGVSFQDKSDVGNLTVVSWLWQFGDGGTSTQQFPSHLYQRAGQYSVSLKIITADGLFDVLEKPNHITVVEPPLDRVYANAESSLVSSNGGSIDGVTDVYAPIMIQTVATFERPVAGASVYLVENGREKAIGTTGPGGFLEYREPVSFPLSPNGPIGGRTVIIKAVKDGVTRYSSTFALVTVDRRAGPVSITVTESEMELWSNLILSELLQPPAVPEPDMPGWLNTSLSLWEFLAAVIKANDIVDQLAQGDRIEASVYEYSGMGFTKGYVYHEMIISGETFIKSSLVHWTRNSRAIQREIDSINGASHWPADGIIISFPREPATPAMLAAGDQAQERPFSITILAPSGESARIVPGAGTATATFPVIVSDPEVYPLSVLVPRAQPASYYVQISGPENTQFEWTIYQIDSTGQASESVTVKDMIHRDQNVLYKFQYVQDSSQQPAVTTVVLDNGLWLPTIRNHR